MFGYLIGFNKESVWVPPGSSQEVERREKIADEFRRFYEELKKRKNEPASIMEYFLSVRHLLRRHVYRSDRLFISFSIGERKSLRKVFISDELEIGAFLL